MMPKLIKLLVILFSLQIILPMQIVRADTGPKPTMDFAFQQELTGEPVTITAGVLYECEQPDCSDAAPLEEGGPQRFTCEENSCYAMAYGFRPYHRLEIQFSDGKTRQSNIFETAGFDSSYTVTIRPEDLLVEAQFTSGSFPRTSAILMACLCAFLGMGLLIAVAILIRRGRRAAQT